VEKTDAARRLGVAETDILRVKDVRGRTFVALNTGVTKYLKPDGGWQDLEQVPTEDEVKQWEKDEQKQDKHEQQDRQKDDGDEVSYTNEGPEAATTKAGREQANKAQNAQVLGEIELDQTAGKGKTSGGKTK
jgi:hypothetical protein